MLKINWWGKYRVFCQVTIHLDIVAFSGKLKKTWVSIPRHVLFHIRIIGYQSLKNLHCTRTVWSYKSNVIIGSGNWRRKLFIKAAGKWTSLYCYNNHNILIIVYLKLEVGVWYKIWDKKINYNLRPPILYKIILINNSYW